MVESKARTTSSQWWWFDNDSKSDANSIRSPWLHSALAELDEKTHAMLKIIEEDADSFAKRAEMYYKKRPELISMVADFYRSHRSLAERFDQLMVRGVIRVDPIFRQMAPWEVSPLSLKHQQKQQPMAFSDKSYDSYSEIYDPMEILESDIDDPEQEQEDDKIHHERMKEEDEVAKLRREIERLEEENKVQKEKLEERDEEKREVIRQLSVAIDLLKEENVRLRKRPFIVEAPKKKIPSDFRKFKDMFIGKLFTPK